MKMLGKFLPAAQQSEHKKATYNHACRDFMALTVSLSTADNSFAGESTSPHNVNLVAGVKDNWLDFHNQIWEI